MASTSDPADRLPLTPATFQILLSLTQGPLHGYGIKRDVEERTGGMIRLGAGTLYAGLQRMEDDGLIEEADTPSEMKEEASRRWRFFRITSLGRSVLKAEVRRLEADVRTARALLPREAGS